MSQPPKYTPQHAFVTDSATLANFPGQALDVEFQSVKATTDGIEANLALIQRDDGALANGSVGYDQLSPALQTAGIAPATAWVTAHAYAANDSVVTNGSLYRALVAHTSGVFATDLAAGKWLLIGSLTSGAGLVIATPPNTLAQSLVANGSLPATGTSSTTFNLAEVNLSNPGYTVSGAVLDPATGGYPATNAFRATYTANGGSPINSAIWGAAKQTAPTSNLTGVIGSAYSNVVATGDGFWGVIGFVNAGPNSNLGAVIGMDGEIIAGDGAVIGTRIGVAAASQTGIKGTNLDAAFAVATGPAPGTTNYMTTGPWKNGFVLSRILYGNQGAPLTTDGKVLFADTAFTTQDFADMSAVTFTGKLFNFTNYAMDANGYTVVGGGAAQIPAGDTRLLVTGSSRGSVETVAAQNTTTGGDGFQISASTGAIQAFVGVAEPGNTTSRFGVTLGGYAQMISYASSNGLLIGSVTAKPVILGANNTEILRLTSGGGVTVPSTVTGGDKGAGTLNASGLYDTGNRVLTSASLGTGIATFLSTPSSANLRAALTDESGSGSALFQGGDLGTPSAGVATNITALNATQLTSGTIPAARTNGHQNGTATNDNAAAGEIGEYTTASQGTPQALTTGTALTIISVSLTAGDWDVSGTLSYAYAATTVAQTLVADISLTNNTLDGTLGRLNSFNFGSAGIVPNGGFTMNSPTVRLSLSATTTVYLVAQTTFTTSTATATGFIRARRVR
jgi:hypothetical protein